MTDEYTPTTLMNRARMNDEDDGGESTTSILKSAGLDFNVQKGLICDVDGNLLKSNHTSFRRIYRDDNNKTFGVTTNRYQVVQNHEMAQIADEVLQSQHGTLTGAGAFKDGAMTWVSMDFPETIELGEGLDMMTRNLLIVNHHDGKGALKLIPGVGRIFCANQLPTIAGTQKITMAHTASVKTRMMDVADALRHQLEAFQAFKMQSELLLSTKMTIDERDTYYLQVLNIDPEKTKGKNILEQLKARERAAENTVGEMYGTAWQAYNVITEYLDHEATLDKQGETIEKRLMSGMVGTNLNRKEAALQIALRGCA